MVPVHQAPIVTPLSTKRIPSQVRYDGALVTLRSTFLSRSDNSPFQALP